MAAARSRHSPSRSIRRAWTKQTKPGVVADYLGARPVVVKFGTQEALATYPELIRAAECPVIDTSCAALLLLAREVHRQGYKVALTGEGADEWLAGYPWFKVHKLLRCLDAVPGLPLNIWLRKAYMKRMGIDFERLQMPRTVAAAGGPNAWLDFYGLFSTAKLRLFSPQMWDQLGDHLPYDDLDLNLERRQAVVAAEPFANAGGADHAVGPFAVLQGRPGGDELLRGDALPVSG